MMTLLVEGGFPMWFLLAIGLAALWFSARFARVPSRRTLRIALALAGAAAGTTLTGVFAALAAVGHHAPTYLKAHPNMSLAEVLLQGMAESLSAGVLGFAILSIAAILVAVGFHREVVAFSPP
jgi:hypothetical protein